MERKIKRGDIYYANLNPVIGSEQGEQDLYLSFQTMSAISIALRSLSHPSQAEYTLKQNCRHTL